MTLDLPLFERRLLEARIRDIVSKYCLLNEIDLFFFGSRTDNTSQKHSDIDIGLARKDGTPIENFVLIHDAVTHIDSMYKIDCVDFATVSDSFRTTALQSRILFDT